MRAFFLIMLAAVPKPSNVPKTDASGSTLTNIFNTVLALAGALAVAYIVWSGIRYMLSQGQPNEIKAARDGILYSLIGIVVVMVAFLLVNYVIGNIGK